MDSTYRKSTRSGAYSDNCVEVALVGDGVGVRDSKQLEQPPLTFAPAEWHAFTLDVKNGGFDRPTH